MYQLQQYSGSIVELYETQYQNIIIEVTPTVMHDMRMEFATEKSFIAHCRDVNIKLGTTLYPAVKVTLIDGDLVFGSIKINKELASTDNFDVVLDAVFDTVICLSERSSVPWFVESDALESLQHYINREV